MIKREVHLPADLVHEIRRIVHEEGHTALMEAFAVDQEPPIFLSKEEAEALVTLAVIEKRKAWLRYPYYEEDHPRHSPEHARTLRVSSRSSIASGIMPRSSGSRATPIVTRRRRSARRNASHSSSPRCDARDPRHPTAPLRT